MAKKDQETTVPLDNSKETLSDILKEFSEEHYNFQERVNWNVSTGSLLLDIATGGVSPSLWRLAGQNNSGKTPEALEICRNIMRDVPKSKGFWMIAEGRMPSKQNAERCGLKFVTKAEDWEDGTIFILESNVFELFIKTVQGLVKNNPNHNIYAFVIDSIDGLILRSDAEKEITENSKVAGVPMLSKKMLQSLSMSMFKFGHWMGLISQVTAEIKIDQYAPKTPNRGGLFSGGNSLLHGSDVIIQYETIYNGDFIMDNPKGKMNDGKSKPIGQDVKVTLTKSIKEETRKTQVVYPIKYGKKPSAIWREREIGDLMVRWELGKKAGSWISFEPTLISELKSNNIVIPDKVQGLEQLYAMLEENQPALEYMEKAFKERLSSDIF